MIVAKCDAGGGNTMVTYIRSDLEFILKQIKIAEAHAAGQPLYGPGGLIPTYNLAWGLRTVDGSYNHLLAGQTEWGAADNQFPEPLGTQYRTIMVDADPGPGVMMVPVTYTPGVDNDGPDADGLPGGQGSAGPGDVFDPTVRTISNLLVDQTLGNPSAILTACSVPASSRRRTSSRSRQRLVTHTSLSSRFSTPSRRLCAPMQRLQRRRMPTRATRRSKMQLPPGSLS